MFELLGICVMVGGMLPFPSQWKMFPSTTGTELMNLSSDLCKDKLAGWHLLSNF